MINLYESFLDFLRPLFMLHHKDIHERFDSLEAQCRDYSYGLMDDEGFFLHSTVHKDEDTFEHAFVNDPLQALTFTDYGIASFVADQLNLEVVNLQFFEDFDDDLDKSRDEITE